SRRLRLLGICAIFILSFSGSTTALPGRVVRIADGDTITILDSGNMQHHIRLQGIDAPEMGQSFGKVAKWNLSRLIYEQSVNVEVMKTDRYGRLVGKVTLNGLDVGLEQIRAGYAWVYTDYEKELSAV